MSKLTVFRVCATPLTISEVVSVLQNPPEDAVSTLPPVKPKAWVVYICRRDKETEKGKHHVRETTGLFVVHQLLSCIKPCMQMTGDVTNIDGSIKVYDNCLEKSHM